MSYDFEDHCWKDVMPADLLQLARRSTRDIGIAEKPALLAIDLYRRVYRGGPLPLQDLATSYPSSCGEYAWAAIDPTKQLFAAARKAGLPIFYTTDDTAPDARPTKFWTNRNAQIQLDPSDFDIWHDWTPQSGDVVIRKHRASGFYGTPLLAHFNTLGIRTVIVCGESTSGCVRASAVEAQEYGFHVVIVEECCFDRNIISHKVNLFDLHHKYADVMHLDEVLAHLGRL
jgi:nicotinamidase-related amidase